MGGGSLPQGQRGGSSSSGEGGHAGGAERTEVVPLLGAGGSGSLASGLRWRQGHAELS